MTSLTCPDCNQTYKPRAGHCRGGRYGGCCRSFANIARDTDPHRTGNHTTGRRCKTDTELLEAGWQLDGHLWVTPAHARARAARGGSPFQLRATEAAALDPDPA